MTQGREAAQLGERVRQALRRAGVTQAAMARELGMNPAHFSRLLTQGRNLRLPQLATIAQACGITVADLVGGARQTAPEAYACFRQLVLLEVPAAVAYDLATGRGQLLSEAERLRLNAASEALRAAFRAGQEPADLPSLLGEDPEKEPDTG